MSSFGDRSRFPAWSAIDIRLWGKSHDLDRPYPIICHLLDTAAIAGALFDRVLGDARGAWLADAAGVPQDQIRGLVMYWAGLHDIGKISPPFQSKVPDQFRGIEEDRRYVAPPMVDGDRGFHHSHASQYILGELFAVSGYPVGKSPRITHSFVAHQIAQMLGGHHGSFHPKLQSAELVQPRGVGRAASLGFGEWERQARLHADVLRVLIGPGADACPAGLLPVAAIAVLTGLVVCADWLASQKDFITRGERLPMPGWVASEESLQAHWLADLAEAEGEVRAAGLGRASFIPLATSGNAFRERFPQFECPNQLQQSLADKLPAIATGPGLLLVTAPTGDGKTEAAEFCAAHLAEVSGCGGLAFALPTQATTDAMFRRIQRFAADNLREDASLSLVHGMAWLSTDYDELADLSVSGSPIVTEHGGAPFATDWLRGRGRGMHAALGAMTIDQLLIGVLPVKHNMLRLYSLVNKVVVIDEAHSYGPWMHSLLIRLLQWLGAMRVPVVVMSATLAGATARTLLDAYRIGCGYGALPADTPAIPYPGWLFLDAVTGDLGDVVAVGTDRPRQLEIQLEPVRRPDASEDTDCFGPADRLAVLTRMLAPLHDEDGCVLVCCNTVAEAQETYDQLSKAFGAVAEVKILHARFRAADRARITAECEHAYGKSTVPGECSTRPTRSILVATQIVEQSIDLDFDLIISDLAPVALLLQRAGRCRRHERGPRPAWTGRPGIVRMVVLDPVGRDGGYKQPKEWGSVYFEALLRKTRSELHACGGSTIDIPGAVQKLVDAVYADNFTSENSDKESAELFTAAQKQDAETSAERQLANFIAIRSPHEIKDLAKLSGAGSVGIFDEALITTRLGADSARIVLVYRQDCGDLTLDAVGNQKIPMTAPGQFLRASDVRAVMQSTVPAPGWWFRETSAQKKTPEGWDENPLLRNLIVVEGREQADGQWRGASGNVKLEYHNSAGGLRLV